MTTLHRYGCHRQAVLVLSALLLLVPLAAATAQALPDPIPSPLEETVSRTILPGNDFFAYANGRWLDATTIPAGKERWAARNDIDEVTRRRVAVLLDDARKAPFGSVARKVADYRAAWLDEGTIESKGIAPLRPALDSIDRVRDKAALTALLGRGIRADVDPLNWAVYRSASILGLSVEPSVHGEKTYVAFLLQGGLGLADRDQYLGSDSASRMLRTQYQEYVAALLKLAGFDRSSERAAKVLALETAIAETQGTRAATANDHNADHLWTRADFTRQAPGMDWTAFFAAAGLAKQGTFVAWQPSAVKGVAALVASQPIDAWQDYLRFRLLDENADVLPRAFAEAAATMHAAAGDLSAAGPRAQRALDATQLAMSDAIGRMYAERYFPVEQKRRVERIVANVAAAFVKRVEAATWMSPATKAIALVKLKTLYVGIGYPEHWQDFSDLKVDPRDAIGNRRRAVDRAWRRALSRLGKPVDMHEWWIAPQTVGGVLVFQQNAYDFPAALLQAPKFDSAASDAASYGAIGTIIGHDLSHYVDLLGAEYDSTGAMRHWWTRDDSLHFQTLAEPLIQQFSGYHPFADASVDGRLTETENVADLAGLRAAFDAYRLTLGTRASDPAFVRQQDREFFIAFAQTIRAKLSDQAMRTQLTNDHAPETYRTATVRNIDAWYEAFNVTPGQKLYLAPAARVRIW